MELFAFIVGIVWLIFPFVVINGISKQRAANRLIVQHLETIDFSLQKVNKHLEAANVMHGDLNRVAQWIVDRESNGAAP